ncbi:MAG: mechanosensitive ion channel [Magnetospirillum sp.]|nr:mechanosensitive ion channel [Magnetospirillum sp.]
MSVRSALVALLLALSLLRPAGAAESPAADSHRIERLVATLEDEQARNALVRQLKTLLAAGNEAAAAPAPDDAVSLVPAAGGSERLAGLMLASALILAATALAGRLLDRLCGCGLAIGRSARTSRLPPAMHGLVSAAVLVAALLGLLRVWGLHGIAWMATDAGQRVFASGLTIAGVLVAAAVAWLVISGAITRVLSNLDSAECWGDCRAARARTLLPLARNAVLALLVAMVVLIVLSELGVNIAPLLAGAGVVGIAIGFGSQKLVQDVITGAFILFENTISVGDVVKLDGHGGMVEQMTIRTIKLRDLSGSLHTIPFSNVGTVVNLSRGHAFAVFDLGVAYSEDSDRVMAVLAALGAEFAADAAFGPLLLEPLEVMGIVRFDASAVVIRCRFKTLPLKQWPVEREFNRRIKRRFDELGIEFPFPQTTVWFGNELPSGPPGS